MYVSRIFVSSKKEEKELNLIEFGIINWCYPKKPSRINANK
jgi:hypothetical protein